MISMKKLLLSSIATLGVIMAGTVFANGVAFNTNKPMQVTYQVAHQKADGQVILSQQKTQRIDHSAVPVRLMGFRYVGIIVDAVDGHVLPASARRFGERESCTVRTSLLKPRGMINLTRSPHRIMCNHL